MSVSNRSPDDQSDLDPSDSPSQGKRLAQSRRPAYWATRRERTRRDSTRFRLRWRWDILACLLHDRGFRWSTAWCLTDVRRYWVQITVLWSVHWANTLDPNHFQRSEQSLWRNEGQYRQSATQSHAISRQHHRPSLRLLQDSSETRKPKYRPRTFHLLYFCCHWCRVRSIGPPTMYNLLWCSGFWWGGREDQAQTITDVY